MSEWISVEDGLPEENILVLAWFSGEGFALAKYVGIDGWHEKNWYIQPPFSVWLRSESYITHWMLLPENPNEETGCDNQEIEIVDYSIVKEWRKRIEAYEY